MGTVITLDEAIKDEVARAIVNECHPGHDSMYLGYAVTDGQQVWHVEANRAWDPYPDGTDVIRVLAFIPEGYSFSPRPEDQGDYRALIDSVPDGDWEAAYIAETGETDPRPNEIVAWAAENRTEEYDAAIEEYEAAAVNFCREEMSDTAEIEDYEEDYC